MDSISALNKRSFQYLSGFMNYCVDFSLPFRLIHGLVGFEAVEECVRKEMSALFDENSIDGFLKSLKGKLKSIISKENQKNMLMAYHMCMWLDQMLTYEEMARGKLRNAAISRQPLVNKRHPHP